MDTPILRANDALELFVDRDGDLHVKPPGSPLGASLLALVAAPDDAERTPAQAFGRGLARHFLRRRHLPRRYRPRRPSRYASAASTSRSSA